MADRRTKNIRDLSTFTIGIGILMAVLTLWLTYAMQPSAGQQPSLLLVVVPLVISVVYIILGVLVRRLKSPGVVIATMLLVAAGFAIDLVIAFNIVKAAIDILIIFMIVKTGRSALVEIKNGRGIASQTV